MFILKKLVPRFVGSTYSNGGSNHPTDIETLGKLWNQLDLAELIKLD